MRDSDGQAWAEMLLLALWLVITWHVAIHIGINPAVGSFMLSIGAGLVVFLKRLRH